MSVIRLTYDWERAVLAQMFSARTDEELTRWIVEFPEGKFAHPEYRRIRNAVTLVYLGGQLPDELNVPEEDPEVDRDTIRSILDGEFRRVNTDSLLAVCRKEEIRRECAKAIEILEAGFSEDGDPIRDPAETLADVIGHIERTMLATSAPAEKPVRDVARDFVESLVNRQKNRLLPVPYPKLSQILSLERGCAYGVAARPGGGKSAFLVDLAAQWHGLTGVVFSLEMGFDELAARFLARSRILQKWRIKHGDLSYTDVDLLRDYAGRLSDQVVVDVSESIDVNAIEARCHRRQAELQARYSRLDYIVVDYLQILPTGKRTRDTARYEVIGEQVRRLRALAKKLDCVLLVGVQCGRGVDKADGRIRMSDLRESGDIEAHSDGIIALNRDEAKSDTWVDRLEISVLKHRGGRTGKVNFLHHKDFNVFEEES